MQEVQKESVSGLLLLIQLSHHAELRLVLIFLMEPQHLYAKESIIVFLMEQIVLLRLLVLHTKQRLDVNQLEQMDYVLGQNQLLQLQ
jgi:hypothetical protein